MDRDQNSQLILYQTEDGTTQIQVVVQDETVWLTQKEMADLFQRDQSVISRHINNVFKEGELDEQSNMQKMHIARRGNCANRVVAKFATTATCNYCVDVRFGGRAAVADFATTRLPGAMATCRDFRPVQHQSGLHATGASA